jgi:phosphotransferase system  glucose/maltose/N-acetylglucosamine-specific IIC component
MLAMFMFAGVLGLFALLICVAVSVLAIVFWIWMLIDAIQNEGLGDGEKVGWVLAIVFLHIIGAILYFFIGHPKRLAPGPGT